MGCDIHGVIQIKNNDKWDTVEEGYSNRNYAIFAILANVRNYFEPEPLKFICEAKGLPADFEIVEDDCHIINVDFKWLDNSWRKNDDNVYWMGDHSYSYLTTKELVNFEWWAHPEINKFLGDQEFCMFILRMTKLGLEHGSDNVRFVFGFDN